MITRPGSGWQTILADLALILFMVSIAAVRDPIPDVQAAAGPVILEAAPVALYRSAEGGDTLGQWLAGQPADPRQRLTIVAQYVDGQEDAAAVGAMELAAQAREVGRPARVLLEPGAQNDLFAMLAFDQSDGSWHDICSDVAEGKASPAALKDLPCE